MNVNCILLYQYQYKRNIDPLYCELWDDMCCRRRI
jgi:hypothetical protein